MLKIGSIVRLPELASNLKDENYAPGLDEEMKEQYGLIGTVVEADICEIDVFTKRKWSRVKVAFRPDVRQWIWRDKDLTILKEKKQ